jgi:tyrosyl-tRNA synthetase
LEGRQPKPDPEPDLSTMSDVERVNYHLDRQYRKLSRLEERDAQREREQAHQQMLSQATRGLAFGDEDATSDALRAIKAYSRESDVTPEDVRDYAERLARRFNPAGSQATTRQPSKQAEQDAAYRAQKAADGEATRRVPAAAPAAPAPAQGKGKPKSARDLFRDADEALLAERKVAAET